MIVQEYSCSLWSLWVRLAHMSLKERIFLLSLPTLVVAVYLAATPRGREGGYVLQHKGPDGWEQVRDDTNEVIRIRWLMAGRELSDPIKLQVIRRRWNLEIEPSYLTPEAMMTAQPLMLSAGDIPDVLDPGGTDNLRKYAHQVDASATGQPWTARRLSWSLMTDHR